MSEPRLRLKNPPIIEAVVDIDCDLPPTFALPKLEAAAKERLGSLYPTVRRQTMHEQKVVQKGGLVSEISMRDGLKALQFATKDGKQVVQFRESGYAFNRLAPYTTLDDYLPEIERTWKLFVDLANPIQIKRIRVRNINRISVPLRDGELPLDEYFALSPRLPEDENLQLLGFLRQHTAIERHTGNRVMIVLTNQPHTEMDREVPVIFDITAARSERTLPEDWDKILNQIGSLRDLKDRIFRKTLTDSCLNLFQ
jgi:uncharacterized protein (TIGR04255 family)